MKEGVARKALPRQASEGYCVRSLRRASKAPMPQKKRVSVPGSGTMPAVVPKLVFGLNFSKSSVKSAWNGMVPVKKLNCVPPPLSGSTPHPENGLPDRNPHVSWGPKGTFGASKASELIVRPVPSGAISFSKRQLREVFVSTPNWNSKHGLVPGLVPLGDSMTKFGVMIPAGADGVGLPNRTGADPPPGAPPVLMTGSLVGIESAYARVEPSVRTAVSAAM